MVLLRRTLTSALFAALFFCKVHAFDFYFDAPDNWKLAGPETYSPSVRVCFVNPKEGYSPSINLAVETSSLETEEYIKLSQKPYLGNPLAKWRNLGSFESELGKGTLIEIDLTSKAGKGRLLQYVIKKGDEIAVLTAASSVEDFKNNLSSFKKAFKSLRGTDNLFNLIDDEGDKAALKTLLSSLTPITGDPSSISKENVELISKIESLLSKYHHKGECWHFLALRECAKLAQEKPKDTR